MPLYRIHRMKDNPQETFRWAAHTGGLAVVKPKDYVAGEDLEAGNPYELWKRLSGSARPLRPGDVVEALQEDVAVPGPLWIAKYIGFEPAAWFVPTPVATEMPPVTETTTA